MTRGPARRRSSPRRGRPETPVPQPFPDLAARARPSRGDDAPASVTVAGTLRAEDAEVPHGADVAEDLGSGEGSGRGDARRASVILVADDGRTYALELPPGWSVDAEPGARVVVTGQPTGEGGLRVRRIATA